MLNNGNENESSCGLLDEMISYLYNESSEPERRRFETHLLTCTECTDEFASVANARFSVFEWRREEFADLPTPAIVIPYRSKLAAVADAEDAGWLAGIRGLFTIPRFALAAGSLLAVLGAGFIGINYVADRQIAEVTVQENTAPIVVRPEAPPLDAAPKIDTAVSTPDQVTLPERIAENRPRPMKTVEKRRAQAPKTLVASNRRQVERDTTPVSAQQRKAPVLNNFEDSDDTSLRLADLFADGGSKR
jgi:hypothetical protein